MRTAMVRLKSVASRCDIKIVVRGTKEFAVRTKLAEWVFRFGAWLMWMGCEVSFEGKGQRDND